MEIDAVNSLIIMMINFSILDTVRIALDAELAAICNQLTRSSIYPHCFYILTTLIISLH